jgi:CHAT domain-containing protein
LTGAEAGVAAFRRLAPGRRVLHLATHAIANPRRPARSILALASPAGEPPLFASDIAELPLHDTDLVVLSSCGSADTGQGAGGLARAFLQAGASYVIGARGGIRDRQAARLLGDFYRRLYAGDDPAVALHGAQTTFRRAAPGDPTWAAFRLYRGS